MTNPTPPEMPRWRATATLKYEATGHYAYSKEWSGTDMHEVVTAACDWADEQVRERPELRQPPEVRIEDLEATRARQVELIAAQNAAMPPIPSNL